MTTVLGVKLGNRTNLAVDFQKTLTEYGCVIKTRLGLHDVADNVCSPNGIILLEVIDDEEAVKLESAVKSLGDVQVQKMKF